MLTPYDYRRLSGIIIFLAGISVHANHHQIDIPRIEKMPNLPKPYIMRDWQQVAKNYDALAFNFYIKGHYLPFIQWASGFDKDQTKTFSLPTFVGDLRNTQESITALGAINAASVAGIDKSKQTHNWVNYAGYYYNDTATLFLNSRSDSTGTTFWYELFPNILFYRIYSIYCPQESFVAPFKAVADRWYDACVAMGGKKDPWTVPDFNHTAFNFNTMMPFDNGLWKEADAAGAIAWLQYMAYAKTREEKYLDAAKWGMEFLEQRTDNPYYEVLLPHGAYTAARMNAQTGTTYDVEKLFNWCFDGSNKRKIGVSAETWKKLDGSGLVATFWDDTAYAFAMNTFDQINCLVPIARYDSRFARAMGKWVLNAANSARLFYSAYLPESHQTDYDWARQYDPNACVAYEGLMSSRVVIDRINADLETRYGKVVSGSYEQTIFTDRAYQVLEEETVEGRQQLEHIWKLGVSPAERYRLTVVGKSSNDQRCSISYSNSPEGPWQEAVTISAKENSDKSAYIHATPPVIYLKISGTSNAVSPARFYLDDIFLQSFGSESPYATGDAKSHRWGRTNFGLYGSSFAGILGGIIKKTNVEGILQLDLLATDYFREAALPSYLYYNPHPKTQTIKIDVGDAQRSLYDTVNKSFAARNVSGIVSVPIKADSARILIFVPGDAAIENNAGRLTASGITIDYSLSDTIAN